MKIYYANSFRKDLRKLSKENKKHVVKALGFFASDPFTPTLKNHALKGKYRGVRSIAAGYDLRILYRERDGHAIVLMLQAGTHGQVYKQI